MILKVNVNTNIEINLFTLYDGKQKNLQHFIFDSRTLYVRHTFLLTCIPIFKLFSIRLTLRKALLRTRSILCIITNIYPLIYLQQGYLSLRAMDIGLFKHQQKKSIGNSSHLIKKQNRHTYILNFILKKLLFQENRTRYV